MAQFASALFADEGQVREVRHALETLLRHGFAEDAAERLEEAVAALALLDHPIVPLCEAATVDRIEIVGWERIAERITRLYRADQPITALGIDISVHGDDTPDEAGGVEPFLETAYYSDASFPFSAASRAELLAAYEAGGAEWQGSFEDIDGTISVRGLGELNAAVIAMTEACRDGSAEADDHDACFIAASLIAVRLHQAVREMVLARGLPRPLAVIVGSNESYPFFDAPVVSTEECRMVAPPSQSGHGSGNVYDDTPGAEPGPLPDRDGETEAPTVADTPGPVAVAEAAEPEVSTGTSLRQRLAERAANEPSAVPPDPEPGQGKLLARIFRRA